MIFKMIFKEKKADQLYAHLRALGYEIEELDEYEMRELGVKSSLGFFKINRKNIKYVNVRKVVGPSGAGPDGVGSSGGHVNYYVDYLIPLRDTPSSFCWASIKTIKRFPIFGKPVNVQWNGRFLADALNSDSDLKYALVSQFRQVKPLGIEIIPEPFLQRARMQTGYSLPSTELFNCLERIAVYIDEDIDRPDEVLLKVKVELNTGHKDTEVVDCCVTDRHLLIESKEPLKIPIKHIKNCDIRMMNYPVAIYPESVDYSQVKNLFKIKYNDESGSRKTVEFETSTYDASSLRDVFRSVGLV